MLRPETIYFKFLGESEKIVFFNYYYLLFSIINFDIVVAADEFSKMKQFCTAHKMISCYKICLLI